MRHAKVAPVFALTMLLVMASGCDKGWIAYQQIEIGRPLSPDHLLIREGQGDGSDQAKGWSEVAASTIPLVFASDTVGVLFDADGNVIAKRYIAFALGHWGLFQTMAARSVMEIGVPQSPFGKMPTNTYLTRESPATLGEYLQVLEKHPSPDLTEAQNDDMKPCFQAVAGRLFFVSYHYIHGCLSPVSGGDLAEAIDKHPGLMTRGYDLRYRDQIGRHYRIRNLDGRRIRIEGSCFRIADPLGAVLFISTPPCLTVDRGATDKQTKTEIESDEENR
jgi:hypothetical protein